MGWILWGGGLIPWLDKYYIGSFLPRRLMANGALDPSFIPLNMGPYFLSLQPADFHVFPDGRVLISGSHLLDDTVRGFEGTYELVWFSSEGYLDTTRTHRNANGVIWDFAELPDGKFICRCTCTQYEGQPVDRLFRIHPDGALDTTFQSGVNWGNIYSYHPLPDGRVYAAGRFKRSLAPNDTLFIARFLPNGALDESFAPPHLSPEWLPNPGTGALASLIHPWHDGNLLLTGRFLSVNGEPRSGICMLDSTGQVLDAFDGCGVAPWTYQNFTYVSIEDIEPAGPDTLYICGAYVGFDDCTVNDTLQRFVSRLLVEEDFTTGVHQPDAAAFRLYPNPATATATMELEQVPPNASVVLRDALGREVLRYRVVANYTTLTMAGSDVYMVELWSNGERMSAQRLVVK